MDLPYMEPVYIAFGLFLLITAYNYVKPQVNRNYTSLNSDEVKKLLDENKNIHLIDVRKQNEYNKEHLVGAKNIPLDQLDKSLGRIPRNRDIIIYCQNGGRSIRAIRKLEVSGFTQLYHLHEGLRGWNNSGYPTINRQEPK
jgi:rhodanese-related sulfurtransferase